MRAPAFLLVVLLASFQLRAGTPDSVFAYLRALPADSLKEAPLVRLERTTDSHPGGLGILASRWLARDEPYYRSLGHYARGVLARIHELWNEAPAHYRKALALVPADSLHLKGLIYSGLSLYHFDQAEFQESLLYNDSSWNCFRKQGFHDRALTTRINRLPVLYLNSRDMDLIRREFRELRTQVKNDHEAVRLDLLYSNILGAQGQPDSALAWTSRALEHARLVSSGRTLHMALLQHVRVLQVLNRPEEAMKFLNEGMQLLDKMGLKNKQTAEKQELAQILFRMGETDSALALVAQLRAIAHTDGQREVELAALSLQTNFYEKTGDYRSALSALQDWVRLNDSVFTAQTRERIAEYQAAFDLERKEAELGQLKREKKLQQQRFAVLAVGLGLLALLLALLWRIQALRARQHRVLQERDQARLELEVQKSEVEKELLKEELDQKARQLTSQALHMAQKHELLEDLQTELKRLAGEANPVAAIRRLSNRLSVERKDESEWERFRKGFEEVNPRFYNNLRKQYPGLTERDERLLALIYLGLDGKECARLLQIAPGSVKMARNRLRKKLGLDEGADLEGFARTIAAR